jgi:dCTP diphosphatase
MDINELTRQIVDFRDARDWKQFHSPNHLATAISIEAAELQEHFLWKSPEQAIKQTTDPAKRSAIAEELADILIYSLLLANELGVDPSDIIAKKLEKNSANYPVDKARGSSAKYTEL